MISRVLSFTLVAAWVTAAVPARAYDPSDPAGPPPDDPAAYTTSPQRTARVGKDLKRCDMMFADASSGIVEDDPSTHRIDRGNACSCHACALPLDDSGKGEQRKQHHTGAHDHGASSSGLALSSR